MDQLSCPCFGLGALSRAQKVLMVEMFKNSYYSSHNKTYQNGQEMNISRCTRC